MIFTDYLSFKTNCDIHNEELKMYDTLIECGVPESMVCDFHRFVVQHLGCDRTHNLVTCEAGTIFVDNTGYKPGEVLEKMVIVNFTKDKLIEYVRLCKEWNEVIKAQNKTFREIQRLNVLIDYERGKGLAGEDAVKTLVNGQEEISAHVRLEAAKKWNVICRKLNAVVADCIVYPVIENKEDIVIFFNQFSRATDD
jgi:hypothetical protein